MHIHVHLRYQPEVAHYDISTIFLRAIFFMFVKLKNDYKQREPASARVPPSPKDHRKKTFRETNALVSLYAHKTNTHKLTSISSGNPANIATGTPRRLYASSMASCGAWCFVTGARSLLAPSLQPPSKGGDILIAIPYNSKATTQVSVAVGHANFGCEQGCLVLLHCT